MKKICFIDFDMSVRGGVEKVTADLVNSLADRYEVHLLSLCLTGELEYPLDERVNFHAFLKEEKRLSEMRKELAPRLKDYVKEHGIDVAILQGNYTGFVASTLRFGTRVKLVFSDHGALMNQWDRKDIVVIRLISSLLCHKVITLTKQNRSDYMRRFLLPRRKVECIYNWIDSSVTCSTQYDVSSKRIVSAGRFGKEKGFDMLIHAFASVAKVHPDWQLDIMGDGEMMPTVQELIAQYGLESQVKLWGMRRDLAERYRDYAMYVLPSYREGMPLVLLEAKANRLPIVSFDIMTGPREIVTDGVDGVLVPPCNTEAMARAICRLIEDVDLRVTMSDNSQKNIDTFSKETILAQWCDLIDKI